MLNNRHFISYFSTSLIYITAAALFFYARSHLLVAEKQSEEKTLTMALSAFVPEVLPPVESVEEPVLEEEIVEQEEPVKEKPFEEEPIVEPEVEEEIIPEPIVEKVIPKPVLQKVKKKPKVQKKKVQKKRLAKQKPTRKVSSRRSGSSRAEKNQFLANIRATINRHKFYPRIAKKRRMQGSVKVRFTILRSGKVGNISLSGPKVFHSSAKKAVQSAFPVNAKRSPISLPQTINLTLRYQLR